MQSVVKARLQDLPRHEIDGILGRSTATTTYFPQQVRSPWGGWTIALLAGASLLLLAVIPIPFNILVVIAFWIWNLRIMAKASKHAKQFIAKQKQGKFYHGLYLGHDYIIFYVSDEDISIVRRLDLQKCELFKIYMDYDHDSIGKFLVLSLKVRGQKYQLYSRIDLNHKNTPFCLDNHKAVMTQVLNQVVDTWRIPYATVENLEEMPEPPQGMIQHQILYAAAGMESYVQ